MDWLSPSSHPHSTLSQLGRTNHLTEFVPRMNNSTSTTSNSGFSCNSYAPMTPSVMFHSMPKKFDDQENIPKESVAPSPAHSSSPISHDKQMCSTNGTVVLPAYQENVGGTTYFYQYSTPPENNGETIPPEPVMSTATPASNEYVPFPGKSESSFFMSEELRNDILNRNLLSLLQPDPSQYPDLPQEVDSYHELYPLEPISNQVNILNVLHKAHLGYQASMYKATHIKNGVHYCLRRIHGFRLQNTKFISLVDLWKKLDHSNIVQLREVFTTKAFGDNSMVFVYSYHPGSETLLNKHFSIDQPGYHDPFSNDKSTPMPYSYQKTNLLRHQQNNKLPEPLIWNYIIQLTSALRVIHSNALACRSLDPTKIILTSKNRLRLSCLAVMDVVLHDSNSSLNHLALIHHYQQEDLTALGKLVLALACKSTVAVQRDNISTALDIVSRTYTIDLRNLIMYLLTNQRRSVTDLMPMIGARFYTQLDNLHSHVETLESEMCKEVQNGRLFRLMTKLAAINERPDFNMESTWSETGDRYMLKLFRDYVFHQVTEEGQPWIDMAHIVQCLNKLDVGAPEKICLMSRDEQSILVVSYAELRHCLDQSFQELSNSSVLQHELSVEDKI
ncbi:PAN2-PAN3 deadenylation complex subunit PAN3 isoform X1 [Dendroctonus ponderosae]|uniref:PAN2-PAN3 deadenylation complex subunit PAN3 n=1 Tax=Dendroctonus ponderosae TaxID=77166 RepID=A0AAR5PP21_DENPD|nr:PAN2-PAN3 deadenylation complex subunit PAN3 isoform X1 [Dendroctonus ponderosae]